MTLRENGKNCNISLFIIISSGFTFEKYTGDTRIYYGVIIRFQLTDVIKAHQQVPEDLPSLRPFYELQKTLV